MMLLRVVGAEHAAISKFRRKLVRRRVAVARFRVDENWPAFRVRAAGRDGREWKQDHAFAGLRPAEAVPAGISVRRIRRDEDVVWRAHLRLVASCLGNVSPNWNDSKARSFHGLRLRAESHVTHRRNSGSEFWEHLKERRFETADQQKRRFQTAAPWKSPGSLTLR